MSPLPLTLEGYQVGLDAAMEGNRAPLDAWAATMLGSATRFCYLTPGGIVGWPNVVEGVTIEAQNYSSSPVELFVKLRRPAF